MAEKYSIEQKTVENILGIIRNGEVAIPEIQRPFEDYGVLPHCRI